MLFSAIRRGTCNKHPVFGFCRNRMQSKQDGYQCYLFSDLDGAEVRNLETYMYKLEDQEQQLKEWQQLDIITSSKSSPGAVHSSNLLTSLHVGVHYLESPASVSFCKCPLR